MKRVLTFILALSFVFALTTAPAIAGGPNAVRPSDSFFGMHHHSISTSFPNTTAIGSIRLWDSGTAWRHVEVEPGVYDFTTLDAAVENTLSNGATVSLVLGGTPRFYAKDPAAPSSYGAGFCSEVNDLKAWRNYVYTVVKRYKGRIDSYEPWNEIDIGMFYCGSMSHAAQLAKIVYQVVQRNDPSAIVTTPSFVDRTTGSQYAVINYLTKHRGAKFAEAVSYHPYGMPNYGPEENANLVKVLRQKMSAKGIYLPVWTTEINYGLPFGNEKPEADVYSDYKQAALASRTFITQHNVGAKRVYWYAWSFAPFLGVKMFYQDGDTPLPARAMETMRWWLRGKVAPCTTNKRGVYTCRVYYKGRDGFIKWHPSRTVYEKMPKGVKMKFDMFGNRVPKTRRVSIAPVLYR